MDEAPGWFSAALAALPERGSVEVEGAAIETRAWGERGRPGLLLMHGAGAHADWWSFLAPLLAEDFRVAAFSWSGMGGSAWRERYSIDLFAREAFAVAEWAGLFEAERPPVFAAHSFGGRIALRCAAGARGGDLAAAILIDTLISPPGRTFGGRPFDARNTRVYATEAEAIGRFRLIPPQPAAEPALLAYVARGSIRAVNDPEQGKGWTWRFDPQLWNRLDDAPAAEDLARPLCPIAAIRGARSALMLPEVTSFFAAQAPAGTPVVVVPEAHHHLMLDQPLALVAALRGLLAGWPPTRA